ncbi:oxamate carbamoyltransferase subunit AllG family protein [Xylophilus sp. ASV27]|uniref:oxamate carbamoyltransferase subunit AllG family protein n=1 Tax=Xylophilus sp. ASV27 TaxID=2795129 RepID=UPI001E4FFAD9|nr:DUF1116 domain-containing protein [Xylophilus sp. ASV27]
MSPALLEVSHLSKSFGGLQATRDVSFSLRQGEIVGLIGPNGAGKTTLVNLITGVLAPSAGRIVFEGRDVTRQRPFQAARGGLTRTFQIVQPFPQMTVLENVSAGALFAGAAASRAQATQEAMAHLEFVGLADQARRPATALTLPSRKRLELAKSLAMKPRLLLVDVADAAAPARRAWSLLGSGAGPQIRFGSRDPAILARLAWRDGPLAACLQRALAQGAVDLAPLAAAGLAGGDELHARTTAATAALQTRLPLDDEAVAAMLAGTPLFFLTLWMAACHLVGEAAADDGRDPAATLVVALAGNGQDCGIRLAGKPAQWHTAPAQPPAGPRLDAAAARPASPMVGDSGVIDALGHGAQALAGAPEVAAALQDWLPPDWRERPGLHLRRSGTACALDAAAVARSGVAPMAAIAMVDAAGEAGLLGRGVFVPPMEVFR